MIQIITYSGKEKRDKTKYLVTSLNKPRSLDEFELNVIDLSDPELWKCDANAQSVCNSHSDLSSLRTMIVNSKRAYIIIVLPQNTIFRYHMTRGTYYSSCELKDMIVPMKNILDVVCKGIKGIKLYYENTTTILDGEKVSASFCFKDIEGLTFSNKSQKITTCIFGKIILTALYLDDEKAMDAFLHALGLADAQESAPEWFSSIEAFDDVDQRRIIAENKAIIESANKNISNATDKLSENNRYKSILYTSGDELVDVIFDILQDMLGCDLSGFVDTKKADFIFELGRKTYIGEIKGVNHNVKSENVSQVDVHKQGYLDDYLEKEEKDIVSLLIINHQKNKKPDDRERIHDTQIKLAKRNNSLIIETVILLRLYDLYVRGEITRDRIIQLFDEKGLLKLD